VIRYQITDGSIPVRPDVDFVQVRARDLNTRQLARLVRLVLSANPSGPRVLVNDRADVAIACGAAGVHLRAGSVSPQIIRKIGVSVVTVACHNEAEVRAAAGADYVLLSPVFSPLSKIDGRQPLGLRELERMARISSVPLIALGGITEANAGSCAAAGAAGVAGITLFGAPEREPQPLG
jgi:thiamine-phosphate pyrophosphorylase